MQFILLCTNYIYIYIYMYRQIQNYIGETGDVLRNRGTVHKQQIRDPHTRVLGVSRHIVILIAIFYFEDFERQFGTEVCTNSYLYIYWSQGSIHPTNFGCDISVRLPVHFLGEGGGKEIRCQPFGEVYIIFSLREIV